MKVNPLPTTARVGTTGAAHSHAGAAGALGCAAGQGVRISSGRPCRSRLAIGT